MSGVLFIGEAERAEIKAAVERARANPVPWEVLQGIIDLDGDESPLLPLEKRPKNTKQVRQQYPSQHLMLGTYHAAISFELQPAGLMRHLSVSSRLRGKVPGLEVMEMLLVEFGFSGWPLQRPNRVWMEEFEPKHHAVNVAELVAS
jgi:hypothetical protein